MERSVLLLMLQMIERRKLWVALLLFSSVLRHLSFSLFQTMCEFIYIQQAGKQHTHLISDEKGHAQNAFICSSFSIFALSFQSLCIVKDFSYYYYYFEQNWVTSDVKKTSIMPPCRIHTKKEFFYRIALPFSSFLRGGVMALA